MPKLNFSAIPADRWWGRLLRAPLVLLPDSLVLPVLQGPARGLRWIVGSSQHGCWLGSYEAEQTFRFASLLDRGQVVYDIGAHVGWYTAIASRLVGEGGTVVAFEPLPENLAYLRRHVEMNDLRNVVVQPVAVAASPGRASFEPGPSRFHGKISGTGEADLEVTVLTLDGLVESGEVPPPDLVKMDVEGSEVDALEGADTVLGDARPTVLLSVHGPETSRRCAEILRGRGYRLEALEASDLEDAGVLLGRHGSAR